MCNGNPKSQNKAANNEESNMETNADQGNTDNHDTAANHDTSPSTEDISGIWDNGDGKQ